MQKVLKELGLGPLNKDSRPVNTGQLKKWETQWGIDLPEPYRVFLEADGHTLFFFKDVHYTPVEKSPWTKRNGTAGFNLFYGLENDSYDLETIRERYRDSIPDDLLPIADAPGGNQICIGVKKGKKSYAKVYFWDHEARGQHEDDLYLIADSFDAFISSFALDE